MGQWQESQSLVRGHCGRKAIVGKAVLTVVATSKCPLSGEAAQLMPGQFTVPPSGQKDSDANCDFWVILGDTEHPHFLCSFRTHLPQGHSPAQRAGEHVAMGLCLVPQSREGEQSE